jgi:hypothetical protein
MVAFQKVKFSKLDFLLLLIFLLFLEGSSFFLAFEPFVIGVFLVLLAIFLYRKCSFDVEFFIVLALWIAINFISYLVNDKLPINTFLGSILRMCIPYFVVKIIGASFFEKLFRFFYILVIISSCFYIVEVIAPSFVNSLTPYLNFLVHGRMLANGDFYIIVYNHLGELAKYYGIFPRNCGFMWEPGAYAWILNFMIVYKLHRDNYVLDKKILLLVLALVSTFSTAGYFGLFFIIIFYLIKRGTRTALLLLPFALLAFVYGSVKLFNTADFMSEKIDAYEEAGMEVREQTFGEESWERVNRIAMGRISLENSLVHNSLLKPFTFSMPLIMSPTIADYLILLTSSLLILGKLQTFIYCLLFGSRILCKIHMISYLTIIKILNIRKDIQVELPAHLSLIM